MKIYYIANSRMPTVKAHGLQIVRMCEAFTRTGIDCELIIPKRHRDPNTGKGGILEYYDAKTSFKITELKAPDFIYINLGPFLNKLLFWTQQLSFALALKRYLSNREEGVVFSRDQFAISVLDPKTYKLYWEVHNVPKNIKSSFYKKIFNKITGLIVISQGLKNDLEKYYQGKIIVASDAVDIDEFDLRITKKEARKKLGLPLDKKIIIYTGHLYSWKGVDLLLEAASKFQGNSLFIFVGGISWDVEKFRKKAKKLATTNVMILGHKPHRDVPVYLKAADCAILTGKKYESISEKYTSPLKLFEYMASKTPIVAQKLPSFLEILTPQNSVLVNVDNLESLTDGIRSIFSEPSLGKRFSDNAFEDVKEKTWLKRAEKIYKFIEN